MFIQKSCYTCGMSKSKHCPDCGTKVGELHDPGCEVERCRLCGKQAIRCPCDRKDVEKLGDKLIWMGAWPGDVECIEFGFTTPGGRPDLNRLYREAKWSPEQGRFVLN